MRVATSLLQLHQFAKNSETSNNFYKKFISKIFDKEINQKCSAKLFQKFYKKIIKENKKKIYYRNFINFNKFCKRNLKLKSLRRLKFRLQVPSRLITNYEYL